MKKLKDTLTTESRITCDQLYSPFRANKLYVVKIISITDPQKSVTLIHHRTQYGLNNITEYACDKIVVPDKYDTDLQVVHTFGIHYFKCIERAYFNRDISSHTYTGYWKEWNNYGLLIQNGNYLDGKKEGHWCIRYSDSVVMYEGDIARFK
jgi:hypothetical protein